MGEQPTGRVVFITGGASGIGRATAEQFAQAGARVVVGDIDPAVEQVAGALQAGGAEALAAATPLKRLAEPEEVAAAVLYLASDAARFMTGSELVLDGGYTAQ